MKKTPRSLSTPRQVARAKVKAHSIASQAGNLPATRTASGAVKAKSAPGAKSSNGKHPVTAQQIATPDQAPATPATIEAPAPIETAAPAPAQAATPADQVGPAESVELRVNLFRAALLIAPKKDVRSYLNGVFVHQAQPGKVRIVSTDGHRLFVASQDIEGPAPSWLKAGIILGVGTLARVLKYLDKDDDRMVVTFGENHQHVTVRDIFQAATFNLHQLQGTYPDYQRVVDMAAEVFGQDAAAMDATQLSAEYLASATSVSKALEAKSIVPYLSVADSNNPSIFTFVGAPNAALYICGQRRAVDSLPAPTVEIFGVKSIEATIAKLEAQIEVSKANAARTKHDKFRIVSEAKVARLTAQVDSLRAAIATKLPAPPKAEQAPESIVVAALAAAETTKRMH